MTETAANDYNPSRALLERIEAKIEEDNARRAATTGFGIPNDKFPNICVHLVPGAGRPATLRRCLNKVRQPGLCHLHAKKS